MAKRTEPVFLRILLIAVLALPLTASTLVGIGWDISSILLLLLTLVKAGVARGQRRAV